MFTPYSMAQPIYEADSSIMHTLHKCRDHIHEICRQHMNRRVQVTTVHGQQHTGHIVGFDDHYLYLDISMTVEMRSFFPQPFPPGFPSYPAPVYDPFAQTILPLVLFNLLTISLL